MAELQFSTATFDSKLNRKAEKAGVLRPFPLLVCLLHRWGRNGPFGCHMDQGAWRGVFQQPQRAIGGFCHISDSFAHSPALSSFGAALAIKNDAGERLGSHAADESVAVPLREDLGTAIEHQITRRDHRDPIDRRLRE